MQYLFRKIRTQLINKSNFKKYVVYALGEILLVMIGIILAFQLNTISKNSEDNLEEKRMLTNLLEHDLKRDIDQLNRLIDSANVTTQIMPALTGESYEFVNKMESFIKNYCFLANDGTYSEAIYTGTMGLIKSDTLRGQIFNYYREIENNKILVEQSTFINNHEITVPIIYEKVIATSESFERYNITLPLPKLNLENLVHNQKFMGSIFNRMASLQLQMASWKQLRLTAKTLSFEIKSELKVGNK